MNEPQGERHVWTPIQFEKGPYLWKCVYCGDVSYYDIPNPTKGCTQKSVDKLLEGVKQCE